LLNKYHSQATKWQRGDIVVLQSIADAKHQVVKRIIALENDLVFPKSSALFVKRLGLYPGSPLRVPSGHVWVEGDAGATCSKSDSLELGPIPIALITARVDAVLWPWRRIQWLIPSQRERNGKICQAHSDVIPADLELGFGF
jgi:inner membrane protease subunit 2